MLPNQIPIIFRFPPKFLQLSVIINLLRFLLLCFIFSSPGLSKAFDQGYPYIKNYTPEEYGADPQNWGISQDKNGFIYVANWEGILEFDGKTWRIIPLPAGTNSRSVAIGHAGTIYVGAVGEFGFLAPDDTGKLIYESLIPKIPEKDRNFQDVWRIFICENEIFFITRYRLFRLYENKITSMPINMAPFFGAVIKDRLFLLDRQSGIFIFKQNRLCLLPHTKHLITKNFRFIVLLPFPDDKMLIATSSGQFFTYDLKSFDINNNCENDLENTSPSVLRPFPNEISEYVKWNNNFLYSAARVSDQRYAFCTTKGGIVLMDHQGKLLQVINDNRGLLDNHVWDVFADKDQNLWAALNTGISMIELNSPVSQFNQLSGLDKYVSAAIEYKGTLYAGTFNGIYYLPDHQLKIKDDSHKFIQLSGRSRECWNFFIYKDALLAGGTDLYQIQGNEVRTMQQDLGITNFGLTKKFPNHIFVGTSFGMSAFEIGDKEQPKGSSKSPDLRILSKNDFKNINVPIRKILSDEHGNLWLSGQSHGIIHVIFNSDSLSDYDVITVGAKQGLPEEQRNLVYLHDNKILASSSKGMFQIKVVADLGTDIPRFSATLDPNFSKPFKGEETNIARVLFSKSKDNRIYIQSDTGISFLGKNSSNVYHWNRTPLMKIRTAAILFYEDSHDIFWIPTAQGLFRFDPKYEKDYSRSYPALIRRVTVEDKIIFDGKFSKVQEDSMKSPMYIVEYDNNSLIFEFSASFYESTDNNLFKYRLKGYKDKWSKWSPEAKATYTNLPEGRYTFQVIAQNVFGKESTQAVYRFEILPPWYRTVFAYFAYIFAFLLFVFSAVRFNTRRLVAAKNKLEKIVKERTTQVVKQKEELEVKNKEIEEYASDLYSSNRKLSEARNALWGEMQLAKKIQTALLPVEPMIAGYQITGYMKPADDVGGDYYDVINVEGRDWIVIGDVSGHGVPAGLIMMMVQMGIRTVLEKTPQDPPDKILTSVNKVLHENIQKLGDNKYMTITVFSCIENSNIYFSGLHQDIMIYRADKKDVELVETNGMWIGIVEEIGDMLEVNHLILNSMDVMLLYTDGITEAKDENGTMYSDAKLTAVFKELGHLPPEQIKDGILETVEGYICDDDVTMLIIKRD